MDIDWGALVKVAVASLAFGVGIVAVYSVGIVGFARSTGVGDRRDSGLATTIAMRRSTPRWAALSLAVVSFVLCAAGVLYGLWLIIPTFHD